MCPGNWGASILQHSYVNPEKNVVVAVAAYFKPTVFDRVDFIREYMEPFICER